MHICAKRCSIAALAVLAFAAGVIRSSAQEKPDAPVPKIAVDRDWRIPNWGKQNETQKPKPQSPNEQSPNPPGEQDENPKRILGIIPNFESKDDIPENWEPMTAKEKYILAYHQAVDISAHFGNAFQAMLQQAADGQPHFGQGWWPYAERFGAAEADNLTASFFIYGFLPHILRDDPRYFRKKRGSLWSRIKYSASRTVITRTDAGGAAFNAPQVFGLLLQQGVSVAYYPQEDRTAGHVFQNWGINLGYTGAYNVLKELYPDFLRMVFHRKRQSEPDASSGP